MSEIAVSIGRLLSQTGDDPIDRRESRGPSHDRNRFSRLINFPDRLIGSRKNDLNRWRYRAPAPEAVLSPARGLPYAARRPIGGPIAAGLQLEN